MLSMSAFLFFSPCKNHFDSKTCGHSNVTCDCRRHALTLLNSCKKRDSSIRGVTVWMKHALKVWDWPNHSHGKPWLAMDLSVSTCTWQPVFLHWLWLETRVYTLIVICNGNTRLRLIGKLFSNACFYIDYASIWKHPKNIWKHLKAYKKYSWKQFEPKSQENDPRNIDRPKNCLKMCAKFDVLDKTFNLWPIFAKKKRYRLILECANHLGL